MFLLVTLGAGLVVGLMLFAASPLSSPPAPVILSEEIRTDRLVPSGTPVIETNGEPGDSCPDGCELREGRATPPPDPDATIP